MPDLARLREDEAEIASALLPDEPDAPEPLERAAQLRTFAYLVLVCATIEEFVENCFREFIDQADAASTDDIVAACFASLAMRFSDDLVGQLNTPAAPATALRPKLKGLYGSKIVHPNNGIKRANFIAMAKPLGLAEALEESCNALLGPADTLGARRGAVAHVGAVDTELRPTDARQLVTDVLDEMPTFLTFLGI